MAAAMGVPVAAGSLHPAATRVQAFVWRRVLPSMPPADPPWRYGCRRAARKGTPGPVSVEIPTDVQKKAGCRSTFWMLDLPRALPFVLTGMEAGIVLSVIGAILGEFVGGGEELGNLAFVTLQEMQTPMLFAVIILLTLIGLVLYGAVAGGHSVPAVQTSQRS
jgi:Binding-protein-dependent transport system inner membrane component